MNTVSIALIGGDLRYVRLCQILCEKGFSPLVYGISHPDIPEEATICHDLEAVRGCQFMIGPIPFSKDGKSLFTPLSNTHISIERFMEVASNSYVLVGALKPQLKDLFQKHNLPYTDMMDLDEVAILNAIPTAEGAIQYAMQNSEITLHDSQCLVLGFGRCGKLLAHKLHGIGAKVSVEARSTKDLAFITTYGYTPIPLSELKQHLGGYDFIFNTIPVVILDQESIDCIPKNTVYIELASAPGGIDMSYCEKVGLNHVPAPSLPGKVAPMSAARAIYTALELTIAKHL
ncbi:MAG: dipicolinate synthase subunit DpsA [Cellulosilyticaceae bacterium]